jgi:hypothetical protein
MLFASNPHHMPAIDEDRYSSIGAKDHLQHQMAQSIDGRHVMLCARFE